MAARAAPHRQGPDAMRCPRGDTAITHTAMWIRTEEAGPCMAGRRRLTAAGLSVTIAEPEGDASDRCGPARVPQPLSRHATAMSNCPTHRPEGADSVAGGSLSLGTAGRCLAAAGRPAELCLTRLPVLAPRASPVPGATVGRNTPMAAWRRDPRSQWSRRAAIGGGRPYMAARCGHRGLMRAGPS
jgi:hypothetical protein